LCIVFVKSAGKIGPFGGIWPTSI